MLDPIVLLLTILPAMVQGLILLYVCRLTQQQKIPLKGLLYGVSLLNSVGTLLFAFLQGYLADEMLLTSTSYLFGLVIVTEVAVFVSLVKI